MFETLYSNTPTKTTVNKSGGTFDTLFTSPTPQPKKVAEKPKAITQPQQTIFQKSAPVIGKVLDFAKETIKSTAIDLKTVFTLPFQQVIAAIKPKNEKDKKELEAIYKSKLSLEEKANKANKILEKYGGPTEETFKSAERGAEFGMLSTKPGGIPEMGAVEGNLKYIFKQALGKLTGKGETIANIVGKESKPQEVINTVFQNGLEKTPDGKGLIKTATQAQKQGKNVVIEPKPTTPLPGKKAVGESGGLPTTPKGGAITNVKGSEKVNLDRIKVVWKKTASPEKANQNWEAHGNSAWTKGEYVNDGLFTSKRITPEASYIYDDVNGLRKDAGPEAWQSLLKTAKDTLKGENTFMTKGQAESFLRQNPISPLAPKGGVGKPITSPKVETPKPVVKTEAKIPTPEKMGKTPSKIAVSIERKAIEDKLTKGFEGVAGYDKITIKDQSEKAWKTMQNLDEARAIVRGEKPLPSGLRGTSLITAMEEQIKKTGDSKLAYELANSPLVSETSAAAQELRLAAERQADSLTAKLRDVKQAREEAFKKRFGDKKITEVQKKVVNDIKSKVKVASKYDWSNFIKSLPTC